MPDTFAFLPNARTGMTSSTLAPDAGGSRLRLAYDVEVQVDGAPASGLDKVRVATDLKGPGDIVGLSPQVISRVEPKAGLRGFEPNYFPFVEFVDADFPWRYSLDTSTSNHVQPWVLLVVLAAKEFEFVQQGHAPLPRIRVFNPSTSLPDISRSWMFAHTQVDLTVAGTVAHALANPAASFARLFAPRRLTERTDYHLFLVPAYEAGRRRGLGDDTAADPYNAPAWAPTATSPSELPVYFQSHFHTNEMEDVETLMRRLRAITDEEVALVGKPEIASAARPGYYALYAKDGETFEVQAALKQPGATVQPFATDPALATKLVATLEKVIAGETVGVNDDGPDKDDPLVAMPPYGWRYQYESRMTPADAAKNIWFDRVNLDLKFRLAAGIGAQLVRENQETYAAKCWEQYEQILQANRRLQRLQWAKLIVKRVADRRFATLPAAVSLNLTEPLHAYIKVHANVTVLDEVHQSGIPATFTGRAIRRLAAKRTKMTETNGGTLQVRAPLPRLPGTGTPPAGRRTERRTLDPGVREQFTTIFEPEAFDGVMAARSVMIPVRRVETATYQAATLETLKALPVAKGTFTIGGRFDVEMSTVAPVYRSPLVTLPLADDLEAMARRYIVAGSDKLPDNTVSAFEENRLFVEAVLVGANHEMNNELRWREFPTDMRGTIFRRFWDRAEPDPGPVGDDIAQIHTWSSELGKNFPPGAANRESDLVIVIRGDIVRKLGNLIVVLNEVTGNDWESGKGTDYPAQFSGTIGPDTVYYGFDVSRSHVLKPGVKDRTYIVLYEPVGKLRFGLDVATAQVRLQRRRIDQVSLPFPVASLKRSYSSVISPQAATYTAPPATPGTWNELSWSHVRLTSGGYIDSNQTITVGSGDDLWGSSRTSASIARSFWQKPLAAVLPLKRVLS